MSQADKTEKLQEDAAACYEHMSQGVKSWVSWMQAECEQNASLTLTKALLDFLTTQWVLPLAKLWKWQKKLYKKIKKKKQNQNPPLPQQQNPNKTPQTTSRSRDLIITK